MFAYWFLLHYLDEDNDTAADGSAGQQRSGGKTSYHGKMVNDEYDA